MYNLDERYFYGLIFGLYEKLKKQDKLYDNEYDLARIIIEEYYKYIKITSFEEVIEKFKRKYICNESSIEDANYCEMLGLAEVYDYIRDYDCNKKINLYLVLIIHELLYSKCDYPDFGGKFRNDNVYLPNSNVIIPEYELISSLINELYLKTNDFLDKTALQQKTNKFDILEYIDKAIDIKCELVNIHPFLDGNGRSARAFLNLLFKNVGLLPVYVEEREKDIYGKAMNKALVDKDTEDIHGFYHYKICDSIYELDVQQHKMELEYQNQMSRGRNF